MGFFSKLFGSKGKPPEPDPADAGRALRQMMLNMKPDEAGVAPTRKFPRVYGVLMDWPISKAVATVFSTSTGAASLYTTAAFGILGGEEHATVRAAAMEFVAAANDHFDAATPTADFPYPVAGRVKFYLLTFEGVRVIDAGLASITEGSSEFCELFVLGQEVLTQLRLVTEKS